MNSTFLPRHPLMLLAVVAWSVFFIHVVSCNTIQMQRLTTATVKDINTKLRKLFPFKVPHYVPSPIMFDSFAFAFGTGENEVKKNGGHVDLPLIRVPSISNDLDRVEDYINFCCTDEKVMGCKDAVVRYLHHNPTGDEQSKIREYYYEMIHNTTKYNRFVFHSTCPITDIKIVEKKFPNWTIALDDFKQLCADKAFTDTVDVSGHKSINNYELITINIPNATPGTPSPTTSLADLNSLKSLYNANRPYFNDAIAKLNKKVANAPYDLREGIKRFLAEKLVNLYVFHDLPNCKASNVKPDDLISFLAEKYIIDSEIKENVSGFYKDPYISDRIRSSFKIGQFVNIKKLPIIVGYDKRKNIALFLDFCKSKSLATIEAVLDELHNLQTSTEDYTMYLSDHIANAEKITRDFTTINFDDFNKILQKKINYRITKVGIPDFSALLMKHTFCSDSVNLSIPDLAYNSSSSSKNASIENFLYASSEFHKKTFDDIAETAMTSNNVNNGMMYCNTIISTIFSTSEIQRYNTAIGWKEPSVINFADQRRFLPYTIVDYVTLDEKKTVLNAINTLAMSFFDLSSMKNSKSPKALDFSIKDFEIMDLTLKKRIIRLKFFHSISRGKDINTYCTSLKAAPTPARLSIESYYEAFEACKQVLGNPISQNIDSYKQTLMKFFSLDERQAPSTKFLDEFNKALKDRSKAFDWDVLLAVSLVIGTIAIFSSFGWWRYSAMLKKKNAAAKDFTEPMPHAAPVTVY